MASLSGNWSCLLECACSVPSYIFGACVDEGKAYLAVLEEFGAPCRKNPGSLRLLLNAVVAEEAQGSGAEANIGNDGSPMVDIFAIAVRQDTIYE